MKKGWMAIGALMVAVAAGLLWGGCETTTTEGDVLAVSPPSLTLTGLWAVVYTVEPADGQVVNLPLDWSVADARLGSIRGQGGLTALYQGNPMPGINRITVRDQADQEGFAVISQVPAAGLGVSPVTADISGYGATVAFSVTNNASTVVLPLIWQVQDPTLGEIQAAGSFSAAYVSYGTAGNNIIYVRDQMGASATAIVEQR